jgi:predicted permease
VIWVTLTIAAAVAAGVEAEKRMGARAGVLARRLLLLMLFGFTPIVTFFNVAHLHIDANLGGAIVIGWITLLTTGGLAWGIGRFALHLPRPSLGVLINSGLQSNTGYLGLPLCAAVLGFDHLSEAVAYDSLVQAPVLLLVAFGVAAAMGTKAGESAAQRARTFLLRNPALWATVAGLAVPASLAPETAVHLSRLLVFAMLPMGFFAVGVTLSEESGDGRVRFPPPLTRPVAVAIVLRLVVCPALLFALSAPFVDVPRAFLLLAAMPAGLNGLTIAHAYGLDLSLAASIIAWSTLIGVLVILAVTTVV